MKFCILRGKVTIFLSLSLFFHLHTGRTPKEGAEWINTLKWVKLVCFHTLLLTLLSKNTLNLVPNCYKNSSSECKCLFGHNKKSKNIRYTSAYKILCSPSQSRAFVSSLSALGSDEVTRAPWHPHCTNEEPPLPGLGSPHLPPPRRVEGSEGREGLGSLLSAQVTAPHITSSHLLCLCG